MENFSVGWEEWLSLPELGLPALKAKTDTGARTSAIHAFAIQPFGSDKKPYVRFGVHPVPDNTDIEVYCSAPVVGQREVTSSNGQTELRYVIKTPITIGERTWDIEITLTNRENMAYRMLLGRSALDELAVKPAESFLQPELSYDLYNKITNKKPVKRPLRIAILTREPRNYSTKRFVEEAELNGHAVELIDTKRCYLNIQSYNPEVHYDGRALPPYDAVIPRIGASLTFYGMAIVRQFEAMGTFCLNSASSIGASRDKLAAHQILARHRIPMPTTAFANSPKDTNSLLDLVGGSPTVLKLLQSTQGRGVVLAETKKAGEAVISAFQGLDAHFIAQEFVKEAAGSDIRCFVVGKRVVGAMMRTAGDDDFRSNLHAGGTAKKVRLTKEERNIAIKAARVLGLIVAGVDIIRTDTGSKVLEVNSSPGIEGIEKASGKNIAEKIIQLIEANVPSTIHPKRHRR
ncbi:30S ribosomal protein S6--L-glutamate ligase [Emcibacteraceae bacterium]|jgi:ribosomal protein S6--L-glutamate ligase|nr:30S ribosomal protein S6--L-glutamate ligase [Kordiimonadaceae bacterium]MDA9771638.1 30S ribosomal protein S6--L-glutamate ligase [Emcibacteraceae bacterium]MDG1022361.1 30S ribosomal protein S6--L-glutamate ligase [Emcibacteraceae bacterium]MDG1726173.1 30S ribosomal protein S6--L-glutamate ligase [Emcibacteraceae bacterium]